MIAALLSFPSMLLISVTISMLSLLNLLVLLIVSLFNNLPSLEMKIVSRVFAPGSLGYIREKIMKLLLLKSFTTILAGIEKGLFVE